LKTRELGEDSNASDNLTQTQKDIRFKDSTISYFISPNCSREKYQRIHYAFRIIENVTKIIKFEETPNEDSELMIECLEERYETERELIAGEGGPLEVINSTKYPLILKSKVILRSNSKCSYPILELHELLHVLGFGHLKDYNKILYPYLNCKQRLDPELGKIIREIYSIPSLPELVISSLNIEKKENYLDVYFDVDNRGLHIAENISVQLYTDGKFIKEFEIGNLKEGTGRKLQAKNIHLESGYYKKVLLKIIFTGEEYNKENNEARLDFN
jgi:hypothetical protein